MATEALRMCGYREHTAWSLETRSPHPEEAMTVSDKTAIITGAGSTRGIGRATAHALAAAGWNVAILDLNEPRAKQAADEVAERQQVQTVCVGCDVTDEASVEAALTSLDASMPRWG